MKAYRILVIIGIVASLIMAAYVNSMPNIYVAYIVTVLVTIMIIGLPMWYYSARIIRYNPVFLSKKSWRVMYYSGFITGPALWAIMIWLVSTYGTTTIGMWIVLIDIVTGGIYAILAMPNCRDLAHAFDDIATAK